MSTEPSRLKGIVENWGGFEELVKKLHETGDVTVERDVTIVGRSGVPRQIDVLLRHKQGLYDHLVIIECKYWKKPVERLNVDAMAAAVQDLNASRGVIFSSQGFQSGAVQFAKQTGIELFRVREPTDEEWGEPGRFFDLFIQVISLSIGNLEFRNSYSFSNTSAATLKLALGDETRNTKTPILIENKSEKTLEELIHNAAHDASKRSREVNAICFDDGGYEGEALYRVQVEIKPGTAIQILANEGSIFVPSIGFDLGISILQTRLLKDRAENYAFVLAVEDCVRNVVTAASRDRDADTTFLHPIVRTTPDPDLGPLYKNGSVAVVRTPGFKPFNEFANMELGKVEYKNPGRSRG